MHIRALAAAGIPATLYVDPANISGEPPAGTSVCDVAWPRGATGPGTPGFGPAYRRWNRRVARALNRGGTSSHIWHFHGASVGALRWTEDRTRRQVGVVLNPHGMEEFGPLSIRTATNRLLLRAETKLGSQADSIIATDPSLIQAAERNLRVTRNMIQLIPNAIDVERLRCLASEARQTRTGSLEIVTVGRISPNKGYDLLVEALTILHRESQLPQDWRWAHFGSGNGLAEIRRQSEKHFPTHMQIYEGASDAQVQGALSVADLFVQPSRYEGSSLTTLEAMAHGRVVVATAVGGIPDKIKDG